MKLATSRAISDRTQAVLLQLRREGPTGAGTARRDLEDLGLSFAIIWALIKDTLEMERL